MSPASATGTTLEKGTNMIIIRTGSPSTEPFEISDCILLRYDWRTVTIELDQSAVSTIHRLDRLQAEHLVDTLNRLISHMKEHELRGSTSLHEEREDQAVPIQLPERATE
jgi:hypothetical protein